MKLKTIAAATIAMLVAGGASAAGSAVISGKISYIDMYRSLFTVFISGADSGLNSCANRGAGAVYANKEPGKSQSAVLMSAFLAGKTVTLNVNDSQCGISIDRPLVSNFGVSN